MRRSILALAGLMALAPCPLAGRAAQAPAPQTPPVFRATVDLVTVDVAVVDKDGTPVTQLTARDFTVQTGRRTRPVVSAEYVTVRRVRRPDKPFPDPPVPRPTTNSEPPTGRSFMFVVDEARLTPGNGLAAFRSIADAIDRLDPADRVGLVALPTNTPRVDLTTDRVTIRRALQTVNGTHRPDPMVMTVGEASAIERMDTGALTDYLDRIRAGCNDRPPELAALLDNSTGPCNERWVTMASRLMSAERRHSKDVFDTLRAMATAIGSIEGPKSLILVSEGIVNDAGTTDELRTFAAAAERAKVTMYGLALSKALSDATGRLAMATASQRDQEVLFDGLGTLAVAGRGAAYMVTSSAAPVVARIDTEMSGYYLLSFARDDQDRDGARQTINVKVNWPDAVVRARKEFSLARNADSDLVAPAEPPADLKGAIGSMLRRPVGLIEMGVDVDAYATASLERANEQKTIVAASFATGGHPLAAVGYEISDAVGKIVADGFEPAAASGKAAAVTVSTQRLPGDRRLYVAAVSLLPGRYRLKIAGIDDRGRRGSLEHAFDVAPARIGSLVAGDLIVGDTSSGQFLPSPSLLPGTAQLPVSIDLSGDSAAALSGAKVTLELGRQGEEPFATLPISLQSSTDDRHRVARATLTIKSLPAGEYTVTAIVSDPAGVLIRRSRVFIKR